MDALLMACTDPDAIEFARRTGHNRILEQLDPDHPDYDPRYLAVVRSLLELPPPEPHTPAPPPCPRRGVMVETGENCRCGPKHLCGLHTKVVSAADCALCPDRPVTPGP